MATYLVTGAAGFIGSWLTQALVERGETVRALDNFSTGKRENLAPWKNDIEILEVDLRDEDRVAQACKGVDIIFHEGAIPSVPLSVKDPRTSHTANIDGTFNLLEGARHAGVKRVVYAASSSAYGNRNPLPQIENMLPGRSRRMQCKNWLVNCICAAIGKCMGWRRWRCATSIFLDRGKPRILLTAA